jgi:hypothetical protein
MYNNLMYITRSMKKGFMKKMFSDYHSGDLSHYPYLISVSDLISITN